MSGSLVETAEQLVVFQPQHLNTYNQSLHRADEGVAQNKDVYKRQDPDGPLS